MNSDTDSQQMFAEAPRELFIPEIIWVTEKRVGGYVAVSRSDDPEHWGEVVADDDTAVGRFGGNLAFMRLRTQRGPVWVDNEILDDAKSTTTMLSAPEIYQAVAGFDGSFAVGVQVPGCRVHVDEDAAEGRHVVRLCDGSSLARVVVDIGGSSHEVRQRGPRGLWDEVEAAYRWWRDAGQPEHTRLGLTVTPHEQVVWLDDPTNAVVRISQPT